MKIKELRKICQTGIKKDLWSWNFIQRNISIYFTKFFIKLGLTANQVTVLNLLFTFGGVYSLFTKNYLIAFVLYQLYFIIDCSDGELARYYNTASGRGLFLDRMVHVVSEPLLFLGLASGIGNVALGVIPAICCENGLRVIIWGYDISRIQEKGFIIRKETPQSLLEKLARFFAIYGFVWLIPLFVLNVNIPEFFLLLWSVWTPVACFYQVIRLWKKHVVYKGGKL
jgi:phosphatidylglycerophosphate synthase